MSEDAKDSYDDDELDLLVSNLASASIDDEIEVNPEDIIHSFEVRSCLDGHS
jgi:hypothetical protein